MRWKAGSLIVPQGADMSAHKYSSVMELTGTGGLGSPVRMGWRREHQAGSYGLGKSLQESSLQAHICNAEKWGSRGGSTPEQLKGVFVKGRAGE